MPEDTRKTSTLLVVVCWLIVGLPAAWGVEQTVVKSIPLFKQGPAAATQPAK